MTKKYGLFIGDYLYPERGVEDFIGKFHELIHVHEYIKSAYENHDKENWWYQIVDLEDDDLKILSKGDIKNLW